MVGQRQGLALGARLHPGEAAWRRRSPPRPPRTDDVHGRHAADGATSLGSRSEGKALAIPQLEANDERAAPFHRLIDAVCAGVDRLSLEVAVVEAVSALAVISNAHPDYSRPVRRALEYIRERLGDSITLDHLADYADLDKFHLCRAFRAQIGMPPHTYLTHLRIARAKELLHRGVRASDVAPLVGFYDQAQLTRHFRRLVGTTPARYGRSARDHLWRSVRMRFSRRGLRHSPSPDSAEAGAARWLAQITHGSSRAATSN